MVENYWSKLIFSSMNMTSYFIIYLYLPIKICHHMLRFCHNLRVDYWSTDWFLYCYIFRHFIYIGTFTANNVIVFQYIPFSFVVSFFSSMWQPRHRLIFMKPHLEPSLKNMIFMHENTRSNSPLKLNIWIKLFSKALV